MQLVFETKPVDRIKDHRFLVDCEHNGHGFRCTEHWEVSVIRCWWTTGNFESALAICMIRRSMGRSNDLTSQLGQMRTTRVGLLEEIQVRILFIICSRKI